MTERYDEARNALQDKSVVFGAMLSDCTNLELQGLLLESLKQQRPEHAVAVAETLKKRGGHDRAIINALKGITNPPSEQGYGTADPMVRRLRENAQAPLPLTARRLFDTDLNYDKPESIVYKLAAADLETEARKLIESRRDSIDIGSIARHIESRGEPGPELVKTIIDVVIDREDVSDSKVSSLADALGEYGNLDALKQLHEKGLVEDLGGALNKAAKNGQRAVMEWIIDETDCELDDLNNTRLSKAAQRGYNATLQFLLDRGYDDWTDAIMDSVADYSYRYRHRNAISNDTARRLVKSVPEARRSKGLIEHLCRRDKIYDEETQTLAIERYEGPPFSASSRALNAEQKMRLIQKGTVDSPARFFDKALKALRRTDDENIDREKLLGRLDREQQEFILLDAINRGNVKLTQMVLDQLGPETDSIVGGRFLKGGWEQKSDDDYRAEWSGEVKDEWLPLSAEELTIFAAAHHGVKSLVLRLIDGEERQFDDVPATVYDRLAYKDKPSDTIKVADVYDTARATGEEQYEHVRDAFGGRPIRNALAGKTIDDRALDELLEVGAKPPVDNDRMFENVLTDGTRPELIEAFLEEGSVTSNVFYTATLHLDDETFEQVARHYKPSASVATRAVNKIIAHPDVPLTRINRLQRIEQIREDFTMDWSHKPSRGSDELKNDPLTFVVGFDKRSVFGNNADTIEPREEAGIPQEDLLEHLIDLGADPLANDAQALKTAIRYDNVVFFQTMAEASGADLSDQHDLAEDALEHSNYEFLSVLFGSGLELDDELDGGNYIRELVRAHNGRSDDSNLNLGERIKDVIEAGADPHGDEVQAVLEELLEEAFEDNYARDHDYCFAARMILTAQIRQGRANLPSADTLRQYDDVPAFDMICDLLPRRRAQGLRSQTHQKTVQDE